MEQHDARSDAVSLSLMLAPWRVGRKVARNIYAVVGDDASDDDVLIGQMDTGQLARECVHRHNEARKQKLGPHR